MARPCLDCDVGFTGCMECAYQQPDGRCCCGRWQIDDTSLDDGSA